MSFDIEEITFVKMAFVFQVLTTPKLPCPLTPRVEGSPDKGRCWVQGICVSPLEASGSISTTTPAPPELGSGDSGSECVLEFMELCPRDLCIWLYVNCISIKYCEREKWKTKYC